jgi:hypothetical protein
MSNPKRKTRTKSKKGAARLTPKRKAAQELYQAPSRREIEFPTDPAFMRP